MILLTLCRSKLIHDSAHHASELMFCFLPNLSQFGAVVARTQQFVECKGSHHLHGGTTAQSCTCGYIAPEEDIISLLNCHTALNELRQYTEGVVGPCLVWQGTGELGQLQRIYCFHIQGTEIDFFLCICSQQKICTKTQCTWEDEATVVVGMFADQIHATWREEYVGCWFLIRCFVSRFQLFDCHSIVFIE